MAEQKPRFGPEHFAAGDYIIRQGDEPDKFYIVTRGRAEVILQPADGLDEVIDQLGPGDYFGEVGMVRRSRRMASVRALTEMDVMGMDYQTFMNWMNSAPEVADEIDAVIEERLLNAGEIPEQFTEAVPQGMLAYLEESAPTEDTAVPPSLFFAKDSVIIHQGDPSDTFYVIIEGFVTVSKVTTDGRYLTINHLTTGDYFGEIGLLDGSPRIATVTALTDVKLISFDRDTFIAWMRKSPGSQEDLRREASRRRKDTGALSAPKGSDS
ncbi:MAG TPA: cyclic nucleotide-binding domain-containing protein [Chloroflexota bacterium]|nr:cyclic nucleotide-binding domain-containing protein [Chloroflexota bacterium]